MKWKILSFAASSCDSPCLPTRLWNTAFINFQYPNLIHQRQRQSGVSRSPHACVTFSPSLLWCIQSKRWYIRPSLHSLKFVLAFAADPPLHCMVATNFDTNFARAAVAAINPSHPLGNGNNLWTMNILARNNLKKPVISFTSAVFLRSRRLSGVFHDNRIISGTVSRGAGAWLERPLARPVNLQDIFRQEKIGKMSVLSVHVRKQLLI